MFYWLFKGIRNRKRSREIFFSAVEIGRGKLTDQMVDDAIDMGKHNEPVVALEILVWQLWDSGKRFDRAELDRLQLAVDHFGLGKGEQEMVAEMRERGN